MNIAHYLFPLASNKHKARVLHPSSLLITSLLLVSLQFFFRFPRTTTSPSVLGYASQISTNEVIRLTNEKRAAAGLSSVTFNQNLTDAALEKGQHMLANGYWAHTAPDGTEPWYFFTKHNYRYRYAGENLARDFSSASAAVDAWMASPSHRENMLSSRYKDIGIAVVEGNLAGSDATIIVQLFGTSLSDSGQTASVAQAKTAAITKAPTRTPTNAPTLAPTETVEPQPTEVPFVIANAEPSPASDQIVTSGAQEFPSRFQVLLAPFQTTKGISLAVLGLLILVTVADALIIAWKRVPRVSGRAFAHVAFFGMIIIVVLIIRAGKIL